MQGLMQDYPLTIQHILWRVEKLFARKEIVTKREQGIHRYGYGDFVKRVNQLAGGLRELGVQPGDVVATLAWNNYRHLELYYAVPCMGGVIHTLNPRLPLDQLAFVINDARDKVLFVDATLLPLMGHLSGKLPTVKQVVLMVDPGQPVPEQAGDLVDYEAMISNRSTQFPWPRLEEGAAAGMCYTSGTTGNPKGVVYTHRSQFIHSLGTNLSSSLGIAEEDVILPVVPMFHVSCWGIPYGAGMAGAGLIFPDRWMADGQTLIDLAGSEKATMLAGVPTIWMGLLQTMIATGARLPSVNRAVVGGSAVPRALMEGMAGVGIRLVHAWGMTETSPLGSVALPRSWHPKEGEELIKIRLTQGPPAAAVEMRITDIDSGAELPWDGKAFGEVQVRGPWIVSAYHGGLEPEKFTADGWFRTGDVATMSPDGYMNIVDRTKDVIKSGGEWISSVDLENTIMAHPKVQEAAVIGLSHSKWQERPVAFVVAKEEFKGQLTDEDIRGFLQDKIARWWMPDECRIVETIPKTSVGKFDKKALRATAEPLKESTPTGAPAPAQTT